MPAELTQETIDVEIGDEKFVFRIPTPRDYARMGARAGAMRRADLPEFGGQEFGLDITTIEMYRGMALFETLLVRADAKDNWPYSDKDGSPVVDSNKFPAYAITVIGDIYQGFEVALRNFLKPGAGNNKSAGEETVGSEPAAQ